MRMLGTIASLTRDHIRVHGTVGRSLSHKPNMTALIAGVAEQIETPDHKVIDRNPKVLTSP
jgi:hypothetical protein